MVLVMCLGRTGDDTLVLASTFPFANGPVFADLVADSAAAGTDGTAEQSTFASANESADRGAARGRAADHL